MASYNPNSKYGRRKNREELQVKINSMSPEERKAFNREVNQLRALLFIGAMLFLIILLAMRLENSL